MYYECHKNHSNKLPPLFQLIKGLPAHKRGCLESSYLRDAVFKSDIRGNGDHIMLSLDLQILKTSSWNLQYQKFLKFGQCSVSLHSEGKYTGSFNIGFARLAQSLFVEKKPPTLEIKASTLDPVK